MKLIDTVGIQIDPMREMIRSVIETGFTEEAGNLYGVSKRNRLLVTSVSPSILAKRSLTSFDPVKSAGRRSDSIDRAFEKDFPPIGTCMGSYHSHVNTKPFLHQSPYDLNRLSTGDFEGVEEIMDEKGDDLVQWIEIVTRTERRHYAHAQPVGIQTFQFPKKLRMIVRPPQDKRQQDDSTNVGYHITFIGFNVTRRDNYVDLRKKFGRKCDVKKRLRAQEVRVRKAA